VGLWARHGCGDSEPKLRSELASAGPTTKQRKWTERGEYNFFGTIHASQVGIAYQQAAKEAILVQMGLPLQLCW
jgi:hypothetical protein